MKYSLCMPVYNVEAMLGSAVSDLLKQTFPDFELILVDDASKDGSGILCDALAKKDDRIRVIHHLVNRGLSEARNSGLSAALGEYVLFLDSDDRFEPDLLDTLELSFKKNKADVALFGLCEEYMGKPGKKGDAIDFKRICQPEDAILTDADEIRRHAILLEEKTLLGYAWNKAYRRKMLLDNGLKFQKVEMIEDILFNLKVFDRIASLNLVSKPLYHYIIRQSGGSLTKKFLPDYFGLHERRVMELLDYEKRWNTCDERTKKIIAGIYCRYFLSALQRNCDRRAGMTHQDRRDFVKQKLETPLFCELEAYMEPDQKLLRPIAGAMRRRSVSL